MGLSLKNLTFDCENPVALAGFWSATLGRPIDPDPSEFFATIGWAGPSGAATSTDPSYLFIKVPEAKTAKNRFHMDFASAERDDEVKRLIGLGATHLGDFDEFGVQWTTLADPEGNEFDIASEPAEPAPA